MTGLIVAYRERFPPPREDITEYYRDELMPAAAPVPDISQAPAAFMRIMLREEARVRARYGFANASKAQDVAHRTHQWCHANHYACVVLSIRGGELFLHRNARGTSGETRDVFSVELLRRAMRNYAATDIPDVDIALDVGDGAMNYDGLPVWSYCRHVKTMQGIPVPDFTFWSFPRLHALAKGGQDFSSLMETFARISRNASMAWPLRRNALFWRGSNLRRAHLLHATEQQRLAAVGQHDVDIDVQFTNDVVMYEVMNPHPRVPLLDFCNNRYVPFSLPCVLLHMEGLTSSSRLKYLFGCGSTVLMGPFDWQEWFFSEMDSSLYVPLSPLYGNLTQTLRQLSANPDQAAAIAQRGQAFALETFQPWLIDLYFIRMIRLMSELGLVVKKNTTTSPGRWIDPLHRLKGLGYCMPCA